MVVPSFTRHSYSEYESVQTMIGIVGKCSWSVIFDSVELIAYARLAPATIPYISKARTLLVTLLLLVEL